MIQLDREKYLRILRSEGVSKALTTLHLDTEGWEIDTFEGEDGYQPEMWKELLGVREFSRELWEISLREVPKP
jgi:hypothetical protein